MHKRMAQHVYAFNNQNIESSALAEHFLQEHPGQPMSCKVLGITKTCGYVDRKNSEACIAQITGSTINRRNEGGNIVGQVYWNVDSDPEI